MTSKHHKRSSRCVTHTFITLRHWGYFKWWLSHTRLLGRPEIFFWCFINVMSTDWPVSLPPASHPLPVRRSNSSMPNLGQLLCSEPWSEALSGLMGGGWVGFAAERLEGGDPEGAAGERHDLFQSRQCIRKWPFSEKPLDQLFGITTFSEHNERKLGKQRYAHI